MKNQAIKYLFENLYENAKMTDGYRKLLTEIGNISDAITELLPKDKEELLTKLSAKSGEIEAETAENYFIEGFKLGLKLAFETFSD